MARDAHAERRANQLIEHVLSTSEGNWPERLVKKIRDDLFVTPADCMGFGAGSEPRKTFEQLAREWYKDNTKEAEAFIEKGSEPSDQFDGSAASVKRWREKQAKKPKQ